MSENKFIERSDNARKHNIEIKIKQVSRFYYNIRVICGVIIITNHTVHVYNYDDEVERAVSTANAVGYLMESTVNNNTKTECNPATNTEIMSVHPKCEECKHYGWITDGNDSTPIDHVCDIDVLEILDPTTDYCSSWEEKKDA